MRKLTSFLFYEHGTFILDLYTRLVGTLCNVLDCTQVKSVRQQACRHIMRLQLIKYPMSIDQLDTDTVRILLRTTRDLYLCASEDDDQYVDDVEGTFDNPDVSVSQEDSTSLSTADGADDLMVRGGIDLILEFLSVVWAQTKESLNSLMERGNPSSTPQALKIFLEAAVHGAGTLRFYSTKETNRKRLSHMGVMQTLCDGIRTAIKVLTRYCTTVEMLTILYCTSRRCVSIFGST